MLTGRGRVCYNGVIHHLRYLQAMSEEQLAALLAKLKDDAGLQEKLKSAADLDAAIALAKEAGFDVSKADWLKYQAKQTLELSDEELEGVAGGTVAATVFKIGACKEQPAGKKNYTKNDHFREVAHIRGHFADANVDIQKTFFS